MFNQLEIDKIMCMKYMKGLEGLVKVHGLMYLMSLNVLNMLWVHDNMLSIL